MIGAIKKLEEDINFLIRGTLLSVKSDGKLSENSRELIINKFKSLFLKFSQAKIDVRVAPRPFNPAAIEFFFNGNKIYNLIELYEILMNQSIYSYNFPRFAHHPR